MAQKTDRGVCETCTFRIDAYNSNDYRCKFRLPIGREECREFEEDGRPLYASSKGRRGRK